MDAESEDIQYFESQERIYPKKVSGRFRTLKWIVMAITLGFYYLAPFIRWDRGPNAPDQAILIDMERGRAYWFWIEIWPQEAYILTGILIIAAIGLFFITSILGRVWCGYLCFQTIWTDLFVWVERVVQGDRNKRKKLCEGKWTWEKTYKLAITHFLWLVIGWSTAGAFVLYFNDAPSLVMDFIRFDVSSTVLMFIVGLTFTTYLMAGFAREQVCKFMCPYARFQSAMFDKDTLIIGYDEDRGEKRGKHKKGTSWEGHGHCIDCTACVQVCPTGIDIRDGLQMDCIACGLCIDACDNIMDRLELPRGLIRYDTENRLADIKAGKTPKPLKLLRLRSLYYIGIIAVVGGIMLYALLTRAPFDLSVLHDRNPLFVQLSDGSIRNGYDLKILNKTYENRYYTLRVDGLADAIITVRGVGHIEHSALFVEADDVMNYHIFVQTPVTQSERQEITFTLEENKENQTVTYESVFIGKKR